MVNSSSDETLVGFYIMEEAMEKSCSDLLATHQRDHACALVGMTTWRFSSCRKSETVYTSNSCVSSYE
jgi:predicted RNA-binding Zn-ribbon protein involved in translation (DUF1610 family)